MGNGELNGRRVRISEQTRNVMQSADKNANGWKIEFDTQERWENNTMGWGSSADAYSPSARAGRSNSLSRPSARSSSSEIMAIISRGTSACANRPSKQQPHQQQAYLFYVLIYYL